jgi:hypothetical protein
MLLCGAVYGTTPPYVKAEAAESLQTALLITEQVNSFLSGRFPTGVSEDHVSLYSSYSTLRGERVIT